MSDSMPRYSTIVGKFDREIVLLKSLPCKYGKCSFCDYIDDNSIDSESNFEINKGVLSKVTGKYKTLEVIDSASFFDLDSNTLALIFEIIKAKGITTLFIESHYIYKKKVQKLRKSFPSLRIIVKIGIESFDDDFRNKVLKKGIIFPSIEVLKEDFDSPCIMVGIKGQTKEMIIKDMVILTSNFDFGTINIYCNNTTEIKRDEELVKFFISNYSYLKEDKRFDVLIENTDFGVGD